MKRKLLSKLSCGPWLLAAALVSTMTPNNTKLDSMSMIRTEAFEFKKTYCESRDLNRFEIFNYNTPLISINAFIKLIYNKILASF